MTQCWRAFTAGLCLALAASAHAQSEPPPVKYLEVPLTGEFGTDITALGVKSALNVAKTRRATHVVFVMDTPGGYVADARSVAKVLDELRGDLKYIVVVKRCLSAGVWVMSRADDVYFWPEGTAGAAVAFAQNESGAAEVDAKFNSAIAAELSAAAEQRGQPGCAYRAMVVMEAGLFALDAEGGRFTLTDQRPATGQYRELDSSSTVLSLTSQLAQEIGLAKPLSRGDLAALGEAIGGTFEPAGPSAAAQMRQGAGVVKERRAAMERASEAAEKARARSKELLELLPGEIEKANAADPSRSTVYYRDSGTLSAESQVRWRKETDEAIAQWNNVLSLVREIERSHKSFERAIGDITTARTREFEARMLTEKVEPIKVEKPEYLMQLKTISRDAGQKITKLASERVRSRV